MVGIIYIPNEYANLSVDEVTASQLSTYFEYEIVKMFFLTNFVKKVIQFGGFADLQSESSI